MSFLFQSTKAVSNEDLAPLNAKPEKLSTNQAARVLPWLAGTRWVAVTWVGDAFDVWTQPVTSRVGKKTTTVGYQYYASVAALVCCGPVDRIWELKFDDEVGWTGEVARGDEDSVVLSTTRGPVRVYWGTETQALDSTLASSGQDHVAYRGQCYLVAEDLYFGQDRTAAPNIQVRVSRFPRPTWLGQDVAIVSATDANPVAVLWDWWTGARYGLGRPEASLDVARLSSVASTLAGEGSGLSPLLTGTDDFRTLLARLCEHVGGYPTTYEGRLGLALARSVEAAAPLFGYGDYTKDPSFDAESWTDTYDEVKVRFPDDAQEGQDNMASHHETANYQVTGQHRTQTLDRPWTVRAESAALAASVAGRVCGSPRFRGSASLRSSSAEGLATGSAFRIQSRDGRVYDCRAESVRWPDPGKLEVEVDFVEDTGWAFSLATVGTPSSSTPLEPKSPEQAYELAVQDAPYALAQSEVSAELFLVARGDQYSTAFDVWRSQSTGGPYAAASDHRSGLAFPGFACRCRLAGSYTADTEIVDDVVGLEVEVLGPDSSALDADLDVSDGLEHKLLAFLGAGGQEVVSIFDLVKVSATNYTAFCVRALYDTVRTSHLAGAEVWVLARVSVAPDEWPPGSSLERYFKAQPYFLSAGANLALASYVAHTDTSRNLLPLPPQNLRVGGASSGATWTTGSAAAVTWNNSARARTVFGADLGTPTPTDLDTVVLEVRSYSGSTLYDTLELDPGPEGYSLTNAYLLATVGASFSLRAYGRRGSWSSRLYSTVQVTKV